MCTKTSKDFFRYFSFARRCLLHSYTCRKYKTTDALAVSTYAVAWISLDRTQKSTSKWKITSENETVYSITTNEEGGRRPFHWKKVIMMSIIRKRGKVDDGYHLPQWIPDCLMKYPNFQNLKKHVNQNDCPQTLTHWASHHLNTRR